jgi:hypothetical protein
MMYFTYQKIFSDGIIIQFETKGTIGSKSWWMKASQILQHDNQISSDEEVEMNS